MKAVSKGSMGACIAAADVGSSTKCDADGAPTLPRHHPKYKLQQPARTNDKNKNEHKHQLNLKHEHKHENKDYHQYFNDQEIKDYKI